MPGTLNDPEVIRRVVSRPTRVVLVGASSKPERASNEVMQYLLEHGYDVVPVHPKETEILGRRVYPRVADVPGEVDVVDIFLKPASVGPVVDAAIARGARVVWMQLGIVEEAAARRAREAGLDVVMDHCMKQEHGKAHRAAAKPQ